MFSSFRALRALLVLASVCSPVLSLPTTTPARLSARALSKRSIGDYIDNLIYLDANKTSLYSAISINDQTYGAYLDNQWSGLVVYGDNFNGSTSSQHTITIETEQVSIDVEDGRETIGILEEDVTLEYFHASQWPSSLPHIDYDYVGYAYWGLDINNPMSPIYSYFDAKWPSDYSKWYYDVVIFYDWLSSESKTEVDFAGIIVAGQTVDWTKVLDITQQQADSYGLPKLDGIDSQKEIWLNADGGFYLDSNVWINGQQTTITSQVPKTPSDKYVGNIYTNTRWSTYPDDVVKALYGGISGSKYYPQSTYGYYQIPCDANVSFTFSIDGNKYDVVEDALIAKNPWGDQCIGSVFTKGQAVAAVPEWDVKIGFQLLSSFYYRSGINQSSNKPYYKLLPIPAPKWDGYTSYGYPGSSAYTSAGKVYYSTATPSTYNAYSTSASYSTPVSYSTYSTPTSYSTYSTPTSYNTYSTSTSSSYKPYSSSSSSSASSYKTYSTTTSDYNTYSTSTSVYNAYSSAAASYSYYTSNGATYSKAYYPTGTPATQIAGNLADTADAETGTNWQSKAHLYEIIIIVLASVLGLGIIGAIVACVLGRRKDKANPSAYRSLHDAESSRTQAPLYGAEGGQSRYSDPYQDKE